MNMYSLQRRLADTNISVFSLHPGIIATAILKDIGGLSPLWTAKITLAKLLGR